MARRTLPLNPVEHQVLASLYVQRRIATDRYMHMLRELRELTDAFNGLTGRDDRPEEIRHYMQTKRRKKGQWPTLDGEHRRLAIVLGRLLDDEHIPALCAIYSEYDEGPEAFLADRALGRSLERRFQEETGVFKRAHVLATAMLELRKDAKLPPHGREKLAAKRKKPFSDFEEAERTSN